MKNKKNLILTIVIIVCFVSAIFAGSKLFTGYMSNENEAENNLTAEINSENIDSNSDTNFNYSFINVENTTSNDSKYPVVKNFYEDYLENAKIQGKEPGRPEKLTYQQAVNISGEFIKYISGYTAHSKKDTFVFFADNCFRCAYWSEDDDLFRVFVEDKTGKIIHYSGPWMNAVYSKELTEHIHDYKIIEGAEAEFIEKQFFDDIQFMGHNIEDFSNVRFVYSGSYGGYYHYRVEFTYKGKDSCEILYIYDGNILQMEAADLEIKG